MLRLFYVQGGTVCRNCQEQSCDDVQGGTVCRNCQEQSCDDVALLCYCYLHNNHLGKAMTEQHPLFKKLNLKAGMSVQILNAPQSLYPQLDVLTTNTTQRAQSQFYLVFVHNQDEIRRLFAGLIQNPELDPVLWFAYPKKTSALYQGDLHRDTGWQPLGQAGFEAVRQVAIDENWSALRFRHVQHIKQLTRAPKRRLTSSSV